MATSFSRSSVHNAGKRDPKVPRTVFYKGERRSERWPSGAVERFVDLQGDVVTVQMVPPGIPATDEALARRRSAMHGKSNGDRSVQGFVEHDKCPLRHGARHRTPMIEEEFTALPESLQRPCTADPTVATRTRKGIEYGDACPHILWLMESRRKAAEIRRDSRRARNVDHAAEQTKAIQAQAASTQAINEKMLAVVESLAAKQHRTPKGGE
jgi:hypothetical protein